VEFRTSRHTPWLERCRNSGLDVLSKDVVVVVGRGIRVSKEDVACYRLYAANCLEMAERLSNVERKLFLLKMAQDWGNLAERLERAEQDGRDNSMQHTSPDGLAHRT
jgi:hypothetical protein